MSLTAIRDTALKIGKLSPGHTFHTYSIMSSPILFPEDVQISFQTLYEPDKKGTYFHSKFVFKIHLSGTSCGYVDNQPVTYREGEAFLIFPFQPHCITNVKKDIRKKQQGQVRLLITFNLPEEEQHLLTPLLGKTLPLDQNAMTLIARLIQHVNISEKQSQRECIFVLNSLLLHLLEKISGSNMETGIDKMSTKITKVFQEMYTSYWKNPSLKSIALKLGYSENGLRQFFLRETGQTPGRFMQKLRMRKALDLLLHSGMTIKQISEECGFSDPYNFSRAFKNTYKCAPKKYRSPHHEKFAEEFME